jgi:hypothetical protein
MTAATVTLFRLAIARARRPQERAKHRADAVEHLEGFADAAVATLHEGQTATWVLVSPRRPVRMQAAQDIATTCPGFVKDSFKVLGLRHLSPLIRPSPPLIRP